MAKVTEGWQPPSSIEEGELSRLELIDQIEYLKLQLGDKLKREEMGLQMYRGWRRKATWLLVRQESYLRRTNHWLASHRQESVFE